jgi:hypothetical protein
VAQANVSGCYKGPLSSMVLVQNCQQRRLSLGPSLTASLMLSCGSLKNNEKFKIMILRRWFIKSKMHTTSPTLVHKL